MRRVTTLIAAAATALALAATAAPVSAAPTSPATSAPTLSSADSVTDVTSERPKRKKLTLKTSSKYSHFGQQGVKVTVKVGTKRAKGKVKFKVNGSTVAKQKVKKGKAAYRMPSDAAPDTYKITASYKKRSGKTKVTVYNSTLSLSAVEFTISKSTPTYDLPDMTGTVIFKGTNPSEGYVDIYENGDFKGGSTSPSYCCMAGVQAGGVFNFYGSSFLGRISTDKPVGTYQYKAFYTPTASFSEYIYSSPITVNVVP